MTDDEQNYPTKTFAVADPRTYDGNPYEVAERACLQAAGLAQILLETLDATYKMVRNAEMERAFANHEAPRGAEFDTTPLGRNLKKIEADVESVGKRLAMLSKAAGYDPRGST